MPWEELPLGAQDLGLTANGKIGWNSALQLAMGDPAWVDVMWDAAERTLGIRAVNSPTGIPITKNPSTSTYTIDTPDILTAASISVEETYSAEPESWVETDAGGGWAEWFAFNPIYYITLPE